MCGLAGALSFQPDRFPVTAPYIERMRETLAHRGPDGAGTWISPDGRIGLGHRRLSIIDLSEQAGQAMATRDETLRVSFNGEIYNHVELRRELEALGHRAWKTDHSDTEVILHAYRQWGIDALQRFRGMFAFALWDAREQVLWLVRDRLGIKPLYYSRHANRLVFASEIKALLTDPDQKREVNEESLFHYLSFLTTPAPETLFAGIQKLSPGTWLKIHADGRETLQRYWEVFDGTEPLRSVSEEEIAHRVREALRVSVQLRKVSDVPVGVFLSGGIDSSTNAVLFSEGEKTPIQTFCVGFEGNHRTYRNETGYARKMAERVGAVHHEKLLTEDDFLSFLPRMIHLQDEPIGDPVCMPIYYLSQLARSRGVVVCQVGEGSDELFWGYPQWRFFLRLMQANEWPVPRLLKQFALRLLGLAGRDQTLYYEWLRRGVEGQPVFWGGKDVVPDALKKHLLAPSLKQRFKRYSSWEVIRPLYEGFRKNAWEQAHVQWMAYTDLNLRLPELLLMRVDKMSMGAGLEARVPFLDHRFVELAMSIPSSIKTGNGELKHILKKAVRGLIPGRVLDREKQGFGVPVTEWMNGPLGRLAHREISEFCREAGLLDLRNTLGFIERDPGMLTWHLLNLALWWKYFIKGESLDPRMPV